MINFFVWSSNDESVETKKWTLHWEFMHDYFILLLSMNAQSNCCTATH